MKDWLQKLRRPDEVHDDGSRKLARVSLLVMTGLLGLFILAGPTLGSVLPVALQTTSSPSGSGSASGSPSGSPSPSGSATPVGPTIAFLNPAQSYDPGTEKPVRPPGTDDPPKISDRNDGVDTAYHLVATVASTPTNPIVEAYIRYPLQNEITVGTLDRVAGTTNTWELFWDIPDSLAEGAAVLVVRLYTQTSTGIEEVAAHELPVDMQHKGSAPPTPPDSQPADETVELTWPSQNGQLGFFRSGAAGGWRTIVDAMVSEGVSEMDILYTTTPRGKVPEFKLCGHSLAFREAGYIGFPTADPDAHPFKTETECTLVGKDLPSQVTGVAAVTLEADKPDRTDVVDTTELTQDSADAHVVQPYVQNPALMKVELLPNPTAQWPSVRRRTAGPRTSSTPPGGCLGFMVTITDHLERPVQGANVDVHLKGPGDGVQFGGEDSPAVADGGVPSSPYQKPDKGPHTEEGGRNCDPTGQPDPGRFANEGLQGDHNVPGGEDTKHRESAAAGTGVGDTRAFRPGQFRFHLFSEVPGFTQITAWVDSESTADEAGKPEADDDILESSEVFATDFAQWYSANPTIDLIPAGGTAPAGSCFKYTAKVRAGTAAVPGINVDLHAKGPTDGLDFCDLADSTPRRAPTGGPGSAAGPHQDEDAGESSHLEQTPRAQHTEGETDDSGSFVFGLTSPDVGDSTITAWIDGEPDWREGSGRTKGSDNDILDAAEANKVVGHTWSTGAGNAKISWLNPSGYGSSGARTGGDQLGKKADADSRYHLVARVDSVEAVTGVDFLVSSDGIAFTSIGPATQVGTSDTWELYWDINVTDGNKTIRAQIVGTNVMIDRQVFVNNTPPAQPDPSDVPLETIEITTPVNGTTATFDRRAVTIQGVASAGTDGVELFYTKAPGRQTPEVADWLLCGYLDLNGSATAPQGFRTTCTLNGSDQPSQVTGVAAASIDCLLQNNCEASRPASGPRQATTDSGDAHRVFGTEASPLISIEPAEVAQAPGGCQRLVLTVIDQTGQPVADRNIDVHVTGPDSNISFCDPGDGSPRRNPDQGAHATSSDDLNTGIHQENSPTTIHTEAETTAGGRFIFGVKSPIAGDSTVVGWVDTNDSDTQDIGENSDQSIIHWSGDEPTGNECTIEGTSNNDRLEGTSGDDIICGFGGNDTLIGGGGNDILRGGSGDDIERGGGGQDKLVGGSGHDTLIGKAGNDTIEGRGNGDVVNGGGGADRINGNRGGDRLSGGDGDDQISGGSGDDSIDGGNGLDTCDGGAGRNSRVRCE